MDLKKILTDVINHGASDVHFFINKKPIMRINGQLCQMDNEKILTFNDLNRLKEYLISSQYLKNLLSEKGDCDFSFALNQLRFRVNAYQTLSGIAFAIRIIESKIPTLDDLSMPPALKWITEKKHGIILVTGPTGSGKSTTIAAMINYINQLYSYHIITIEDPIEYLHQSQKSMITQREVGQNVESFYTGLKSALRQDPDVILVGEMRDRETVETALNAAETGHLVLSTLHTSNVIEAVDRVLHYFPGNQQEQIQSQLANCFEGIIAQKLISRKDGNGRVAALEILTRTPATTNLIRTGRAYQLNDYLRSESGMQLMSDAIEDLKLRNVI